MTVADAQQDAPSKPCSAPRSALGKGLCSGIHPPSTALQALRKRLQESDDALQEALRKQEEEDNRVQQQVNKLLALQDTARSVIRKLVNAEEATESSYTCLSCLSIFNKPVTCVPCGHTFCAACMPRGAASQRECKECGLETVHTFPAETLDLLAGKFKYRKQVLSELLHELG